MSMHIYMCVCVCVRVYIYTSKYDNLIFVGNFNTGVDDTDIEFLCSNYNFTSMVNKTTC